MRRYARFAVMLLALVLALTGCTNGTATSAQPVPPTATAVAATATLVPTSTPAPAPTPAEGEAAATPSWQPAVGQKVTDFELKSVDGTSHRLSEYIGKPMVLNFWATWCPHCQSEIPTFEQVYSERADEGFVLVAVSVGETPETVQQFVSEKKVTFPVLLDSAGEVGAMYQVRGIPASFFVDRNGVIRGTHVGAITDAAALNQVIDQLME